jgi:putative glutamine amidotransferase
LPFILLFRFGNRKGPLIAVAVSNRWPYYLQYLRIPYDFAVWRAGGRTVTISPSDSKGLKTILAKVSGIILTGGQDIDPKLHNGQPTALELINSKRDKLEIEILKENKKLNLPVLCICRGSQLLTVYNGGKLECHDSHAEKLKRHCSSLLKLSSHDIKIFPDTELSRILQQNTLKVISFHHHAACFQGKLKISAIAIDDDCIEAVECPDSYWTVGVQWHPELQAPFSKLHQALFNKLLDKAGNYNRDLT